MKTPHSFLHRDGPRLPAAREAAARRLAPLARVPAGPSDVVPTGDMDAACRDLEHALQAGLCVTSVVIRLHRSGTTDIEYRGATDISAGPSGAMVRLMIRDDLGIVGDIDVIDRCHPTCSGRAIQRMAEILEAHAGALRRGIARRASEMPH